MTSRCVTRVALATLVLTLSAPAAFAQGGGASTTGTISGRVTDTSQAVLPGVTVTITSPSLIGTQNAVTNEQGLYRFPAVPPGTYTVTYELPGFNTLRRESIDIALGFTATLNVELGVAALQETVTVTGESPVIDTSATRVQENFKLEELNSLPNARDMWALLSVTPSVAMNRIDVGGNRAGTQTTYTAYGYGTQDQQVRVLVEGINTTEGTGGAGFYFDYGSFEEVFLGTAGQGAEMPSPGVQSQFLGKSGGNNFQGSIYLDYENNSMQGSNIDQDLIDRAIVRDGSNEIETYRDFNINVGGPIKRDKLWWYFSYRDQKNGVNRPNFRFEDSLFTTRLWNPSGKATYLLNQNHKLIGYYQWGQKIQPLRPRSESFNYFAKEDLRQQDSGSWVYKGEWNGTLTNNLYAEARYGDFGYYFPLVSDSTQPYLENNQDSSQYGGDQRQQLDRDRKQATGAISYFKDGWLGGSHNFRIGGEVMYETQWEGFERRRANHIAQIFDNNGLPSEVFLDFPTASGPVGSINAHNDLLSIAKLDHVNAFISDQYEFGRATVNVGVRFDRYKAHIPEQVQLAFTNGNFSVPDVTFPAQTFFTWNSVVPRVGAVLDLTGDGRMVAKLNYGYFKHNPGSAQASAANPNQAEKYVRLRWTDTSGDRLYQPGEEGAIIEDRRAGAVLIDPEISQPYSHEVSAFVERQLSTDVGARFGFVYKTNDNLTQRYQPFRPISAYSVPFLFNDSGPDGLANTTDDQSLEFFGVPSANINANFPATTVIQNVDAIGRYKAIEASVNKRMSNRWSGGLGFGYTWTKEHSQAYRGQQLTALNLTPGFPNNPNDPDVHEFTGWGMNAHATIEAPWGIRLVPVYRFQQGQAFGRTLQVTAPASCACTFSGTILVEPVGTRRMDDVSLIDVRAEKHVRIHNNVGVRLFLDVFNITNTDANELIIFRTGSTFETPTAIVAPRVARVGFRFEW